jgi:lipopolysaccharide transport system permease protein
MVQMNPHEAPKTSPTEMYFSIRRNWQLAVQMSKREILGRYKGSMMGLAWSFFNPVLMLAVYTFFFSIVFKSRWGGGNTGGHADFAVILFVGLIVHGLFAECINRAPMLITGNSNYVKKIIFPLEIFPWIALGSALFHSVISVVVLLILQLLLTDSIPWTAIFFPVILTPLLFVTLGAAWFLASIGVYLRDIGQTIGLVTSVMLFLSPVFYPVSTLSPKMQFVVMFNPLTLIIEESRKVLLFGEMPNWAGLSIYLLFSLAIAWGGFWWFQKTRKGFADVL